MGSPVTFELWASGFTLVAMQVFPGFGAVQPLMVGDASFELATPAV